MSIPLLGQKVMTMEDAVELGLKNNFNIRIARNTAEIAGNNTGKGTANFLPTLNATGNYSYSNTKQETNSPFSFGNSDTKGFATQLTLNWTLFDGFRMFADRSRYLELAKLGEYQARTTIETNVIQIMQAYFNYVQQQQLLEVAESNLAISESRYEKSKVRNELGGASSTDLLNAQVSLNNDKSEYFNQQLAVSVAKKNLNILLAQEPGTEIIVDNEIEIPEFNYSYEQILETAGKNNNALLSAKQNKSVAENNLSLANSTFYPNLSFNANYGYSDRTVASDSPRFTTEITTLSTDYSVGVNLSFNLFNGLRDNINSQNAKIDAKNAELALMNVENQLAGLVKEKYATLQKRLEVVELEIQNVKAAEQNLSLQQDKYETGTTTSLEFRDAQVNLSRAQTALISARYQARITILELEQIMGMLKVNPD